MVLDKIILDNLVTTNLQIVIILHRDPSRLFDIQRDFQWQLDMTAHIVHPLSHSRCSNAPQIPWNSSQHYSLVFQALRGFVSAVWMPKLVFGHYSPKDRVLGGSFRCKNTHFCNLQVKMWLLKDLGWQMDIASSPSVVDESIIFNPNMLNPWNFSKEGK